MLANLDIFDPSSYPTRRQEDWKYSDLSRVLREAPHKLPFEGGSLPRMGGEGVYYEELASTAGRAAGVDFGNGRMELRDLGGGDWGSQYEAKITLEAGRSLVLFENYSGTGPYVQSTTIHFDIESGARLTRVVVLDEPEDAVSIRRSTVETAPGSVFKQYVFSTGAKFQRFETHVTHAGHGAEVEMHGAYLLKDRRHFDLTTRVNHAEVNGLTAQLIKGLVKDQATAVFQGRILVQRGADGTDARMRHQSLILNDGAHVRAKPELEIYADDVSCAHGNTIGALDEEALFFCQSRGMDEATARALLTHAFVMPVAEMIEDEQLRATVMEFLEREAEVFHAV